MGEGKTFSDAYNTPEEERRRRAREAAKQAPQTQRPQNTQYVNGLVSGGGVRAQEDRRREVARNAARQQVQNPIGGFLSGVLSKGKDVVDLAQKGVEFNVDLLKNPEKLVDAGETARKAIINATPPAQLYNRIRTDQRVQKNRQEVDQAEQRINSQLKEQTGGQVSDLTSAIKTLSARRSELSPEGKKSLLSLLDINRQLAGARQQTEEVNLQNVDPVGILEDALFTGGQPVADMARELSARGGARIVKELEDNRLAKAMVPFIGETSKGIDIAQGSNLGKFVFGRGKVDKASDDIKSFTKDIPILRDIFKYAPLATAGGIAINLPGIGGTKAGKFAKASKELSLVDNVDDVVKVIGKYDDLNKLFGEVDDTLKPILLERLAKETKPKEIQKSIRGSLEATKRLQLEAPQVGKTDTYYHGSQQPLDKLDFNRTAPKGNELPYGVHFTTDKTLAGDFANGTTKGAPTGNAGVVSQATVNAPNALDVRAGIYRQGTPEFEILKQIADKSGVKGVVRNYSDEIGNFVADGSSRKTVSAIAPKEVLDNANPNVIKQVLKANGKDGAIKYSMLGTKDPLGGGAPIHTDSIAVLDKNLVKQSAQPPKTVAPNNQRTIDSYSTPKPITEYKVGEKVSVATAQGGEVNGTITRTPDFSKDLRIKGNNFSVKLEDGTIRKTDGAGFGDAKSPLAKDPLESLKQEARKYKSADTFAMNIKDKEVGDNLVVYKGTGGDLDMGGARGFDYLKKVGDSQKDMPKNTSSFSQDKFFARQYGVVTPYTVPKKDIMPKEQYSKLIGEVTGVGDNSGTALRGMWRRSDKYPSVIPDVKKAGYKGFTDVNGEIVMFDRSSLTDLYNQAKSAPVESKGINSTLDELQNLQPEEIAKIDDLAKQAGFKGLDDVAQSLKPKAVSNISEATPSKAPVDVVSDVKNEVALAPRTTDEAVREIAGALGRDIGEVDESLGTSAKAISAVTGGKFTNTRKLNPFRLLSDYLGGGVAKQGEKAITGKGSKTLRGIEGFFGGAGRTADVKQIPRQFEGRLANIGDLVGKANKESNRILDSIKDARKQLDLVMRDNAYIKRVYGDGAEKLSPDNLPPKLKKVYEQYTDANKVVNDINLQTKVIDKAQWLGGTKGQHIARKFDIPKGEKEVIRDHVRALFDQTAGVKRKDISKFEDELIALLDKDPIKAIEFRTEMALRNLAFTEALDGFKANDFIKNVAPNKGFIQMTGKRWGKYDGKFIERGAYEQLSGNRQFLSDMSTSFNNLLETYQRSGIGQLDRIQKAFKTTLNAGTSVGNLLSNPFLFNLGAGTNPVTQLYDMAGAFKQMRKGMSEGNVYLARELGVIGGDTGRILTGSSNKAASALGDATIGIPRKVLNKAGQIYGGIDDVAKLGLFNRLVKKGVDPQEAAQEVARFTQDYNQVGRTVQLIADMPVVGKPFARFSPELVRIIKNNVTRAPHRIIAGVAGLAYLNNRLSKDANETDEERRTREDAVGQTMIPGTAWINKQMGGPERDVSLNIPINDSAVNIARMVGLNFPIEPGIDPSRALLEQLIPVEIPIRKNAIGETVFDPTKIVTSMTFRPIIEQVFDQNFMDKKISDPTNVTYDSQGNVMKNTPPSTKDQLINRGLAFGASVLPMGYEATSIGSSIAGRPGPTGKNRSVIDSVLRSFGLKAEKNDSEARAKRTDTANFFEVTKPAQDKFLQENKDLESLYFQVYPKTKDRNTGKKISDQISPEKWAKVSAEKSGRLFEFMKSQAVEANKRDKTQPIDPIYKLKKDQAREVLRLRARPTGDDVEREQILRANTDWYPKLEKNERAYYKDLSKYFDKLKKEGVDIDSSLNDRVKKYNNVKYPAQPKLLKDYYRIKNKDQAKAYLKQFDKDWVSSQFDKDSDNRLEYVNAKRAIEGASPISKKEWDNVTFGYEDDESKVATKLYFKNKGKGYGYGSGSGKGGKGGKSGKTAKDKRVPLSSLTSYIRGLGTDIPDVASQIRAPEVRLRLPSPAPSRAKRVTIKFR